MNKEMQREREERERERERHTPEWLTRKRVPKGRCWSPAHRERLRTAQGSAAESTPVAREKGSHRTSLTGHANRAPRRPTPIGRTRNSNKTMVDTKTRRIKTLRHSRSLHPTRPSDYNHASSKRNNAASTFPSSAAPMANPLHMSSSCRVTQVQFLFTFHNGDFSF